MSTQRSNTKEEKEEIYRDKAIQMQKEKSNTRLENEEIKVFAKKLQGNRSNDREQEEEIQDRFHSEFVSVRKHPNQTPDYRNDLYRV